jgi:tetratricopeptide (TPR) repeat protein
MRRHSDAFSCKAIEGTRLAFMRRELKASTWRVEYLLVLLLCSAAAAGERQYRELKTSEFTLVSAVNERQTRQIALQVAMFRAAVEQAFGVPLSTAIPMRIYALDRKDWEAYAQPRAGVAGYFSSQPFSSDLLFDAEDEAGGAYELMFHEYMHYIVRTFWVDELPAFFDEGLAEVFSTARFEKGRLLLPPRTDHVRFLRRHPWLPFDQMLQVRRQDAEYTDHALAPAFYAHAWATLYYVIANDATVGGRVMGYVRKLNAGATPLAAAEHLIGESAVQANGAIAQFLRDKRQSPPEVRLNCEPGLETAPIRVLDRDESTLALAELLLRLGKRHEQASRLFEDVQQRQPQDARTRVGLAWARLQVGESALAGTLFDAVSESSEVPRTTAIALGRGLFQVAAATQLSAPLDERQRERLKRARALFASALDDKTTRLEAVNGYVLTSLALDERDESLIGLAQSAYKLAPRSSELAVGLALLHELDGRRDVARTYWREAARNSHAGPMRARILSVLERDASKSPHEPLNQSPD